MNLGPRGKMSPDPKKFPPDIIGDYVMHRAEKLETRLEWLQDEAGNYYAVTNGTTTMDLKDVIATALSTEGISGSEMDAWMCCASGDVEGAKLRFAALSLEQETNSRALIGLAHAMDRLEEFDKAERLSALIAEAPGFKDPIAYTMAGFCSFMMGDKSKTQRHLSQASRLARASQDFEEIRKYAQRLLLIQNFGGVGR